MAARIEIECPHCRKTFGLNSREPLGKRVPCPKCHQPFVAKQKSLEIEFEDSAPDLEVVEPPPASPQRRKRPSRRRPPAVVEPVVDYEDYDERDDSPVRRKKRSSGRAWKLPLIIGGSVLAVVLIGLAIWMFVGKAFAKSLDLAWLPEDAHHITVVRYADLWNAELVQNSLNGKAKDDIRAMKSEWGIEPKEIASVTTAQTTGDRVTVLRSTIDLDEQKIVGNAGSSERKTHSGETYYRVGYGGRFYTAIYFPDSRTAISGSEKSVQLAIDRGPNAEPREELKFIDGDHHVLTIYVRRGSFEPPIRLGLPVHKIRVNATRHNISSSIETVWQVKFESPADAAEYEERVKDIAGRQAGPFGNFARSGVERSISRNGDVITTRATITPRKLFGIRVFPTGLYGLPSVSSVAKNPERLFGMTWYASMKRYASMRNVVEVDLRRFRGKGNMETAARDAVLGLPGLDAPRIQIAGRRMTLYFDYHQRVDTREIDRRLRQVGFTSTSVRNRGRRTVK